MRFPEEKKINRIESSNLNPEGLNSLEYLIEEASVIVKNNAIEAINESSRYEKNNSLNLKPKELEEIKNIILPFQDKIQELERTTQKSLRDILNQYSDKILNTFSYETNNLSAEEKLFSTTPFEADSKINEGSAGGTHLVKMEGGEYGIFKEFSNFGGEKEEQIKRERAAFLVSNHLGFNVVPLTVIRSGRIEGKRKKGSYQKFVKGGIPLKDLKNEDIPDDELMKMHVFDIIICNEDRNSENVLLKDNKLIAIDHGSSFREDLSTKDIGIEDYTKLDVSDMRQLSIPNEVINCLKNFSTNIKKVEELKDELSKLFGINRAKSYINRINAFYQSIDENGKLQENKFKKLVNIKDRR